MLSLMMMMTMILILMSLLIMILTLVSKKSFTDKEKSSPFECGFDPKSSSRLPFSIQFFLIAIIFLIFDIEIALIMPLILIMKISNMMNIMMISMIFIVILIGGLFYEWNKGTMNWMF